jgi:hypothetical protein
VSWSPATTTDLERHPDVRLPGIGVTLRRVRLLPINRWPVARQVTDRLAGYNRVFPDPPRVQEAADRLVAGMGRVGYRLVDSGREPHGPIRLPYDPAYGSREYSGLYFRAEPR